MKKIALALMLLGTLMVACGGADPTVTQADQGGFVPPAEEPLAAPETEGGTCIDMKAAIAARESADTHQGLILEAWNAGDVEQAGSYTFMVNEDFWAIHLALEASTTGAPLADAASYGYELASQLISQAQVQYDTGNNATGDELMVQANDALANGDAANVELTKVITTTDLDGAPLCEPVIDDGAFKVPAGKVELR